MTLRLLAEANVANMRAPIDSEEMAEFRGALERINAIADAAPGFVWRLPSITEGGEALNPFDDPLILFNMSVWESIEALKSYAYRSDHGEYFRRRKEWFHPQERAPYVLWWIEAGSRPAPSEGRRRLELLWKNGASEDAFTFRGVDQGGQRAL